MGEWVWTAATVGGKLTKATAKQLEKIGSDWVGSEGCGDLSVDGAIAQRKPVDFQGEVNYGDPIELRTFCEEHGLAYHVSYGAAPGAFDAGLIYWFPDMEGPEEHEANDDGEPVVSVLWLRNMAYGGASIEGVVAQFERAFSSSIPPLELIPSTGAPCRCQDCGKVWPEDELDDLEDANERVSAGERMPEGQCPECGAVCHREDAHAKQQ